MALIKSILVGLVLTILVVILWVVVIVVEVKRVAPSAGPIGIDLDGIMSSHPAYWLVLIAAFCIGFSWEYKRARRRSTR